VARVAAVEVGAVACV
jgi:hypothetical protein